MSEQIINPENQPSGEEVLRLSGEFLEHFGITVDPYENPEEFRGALKQLNPRYKGERTLVRWELEADQTEWDEKTEGVIMRTAESMGMLDQETHLPGCKYDAVIVMGGARKAPVDRAEYVKGADTDLFIVAGSERPLPDKEKEVTAEYAPGAQVEYDLSEAVAQILSEESDSPVWALPVRGEKVGTPQVIEAVLARVKEKGALPEGARIGVVTTQIYKTATELDANRIAKQYGVAKVDIAGNPSDPEVVAKRTPATYAAEVLRTLRSASNDIEANNTPL